MTTDAFLYDAVRTPFGKFNGGLSGVRPDDLGASVLSALRDRNPDLDPADVDDVVFGNANGAGEENRNVGRMAALLAGYPTSVPGVTVNRLCGSSLDAAMIGSRQIETGDAELVLTGGVESMTRAPWVLPKPARAFPAGNVEAVSTTLGWRLVNPRMPQEWTVSLGEANELLAEKFDVSRERQDEFAVRSHTLADEAWSAGFYDDLVVAVEDLSRDEGIRAGSTVEGLAKLKPSFRSEGTITAGNASPLSDGASAVLLGSERMASRVGRSPLARVAGRAAHALDPQDFGYAPVEAAEKALRRAGIGWSDVGAVELNEAFAVQSLVCVDTWAQSGLDPDDREHARRRHRDRSPVGRLRRPGPRHARQGDARGRPPLGCGRHLHRRRAGPGRRAGERRMSTAVLQGDQAADEAVADIPDGATVLIGGFGPSGQPTELIDALRRHGASDLTVVNNNAGNGDVGLAALLKTGAVRKIICSFPRQSDSWVFDELYRSGRIELEVVPQGNLAERMRAAGAGIGGFFTPTGVGTPLAEGKEVREIEGREYMLEYPLHGDYALVKAHTADGIGNLVYRKTARNFGPVMATAATTTVAQVQSVVPVGDLDPEVIVTPSIYVDKVVVLT